MLFKNIKTGNILLVSNGDSIKLIQRSPIYESVKTETKDKPKATKETKARSEKVGS